MDFSSAFNTMQAHLVIDQLAKYNVNPSIQLWVLDFLTSRLQMIKTDLECSSWININTGSPQGCVLFPVLFIIYTNELISNDPTCTIFKYADDSAIVGLITNNIQIPYLKVVRDTVKWCQDNYLSLNVSKTKELISDPKKTDRILLNLIIQDDEVEIVKQYKYLGCIIDSDLTWKANTVELSKKVQKNFLCSGN